MYNLYVHSKYRWLKSVKYKNLVSLSPNFAFDINPFYTYRYRCPGDFVDCRSQSDIPNGYIIEDTCISCFNGKTGSWQICC